MKVGAEYEHSDTFADNAINLLHINLNILFW